MKRLMSGMVLILLLAGGFPLRVLAAGLGDTVCDVKGGNNISFPGINLRASGLSDGETIYQSPTYTINYICDVYPSLGVNYSPSLQLSNTFRPVVERFRQGHLGMDITIQEEGTGRPSVTLLWSDIDKNGSSDILKPFGADMPGKGQHTPDGMGYRYTRSATVSFRFFVQNKFDGILIANVPSGSFNIASNTDGYGKYGTPVQTSAFSIRFLPGNLGQVDIIPSQVNLGRIYTTAGPSSRTAYFKVTARQVTGASTSFSVPLMINFQPPADATTTDEQYITLVNRDRNANGLRLSVKDDTGKTVKFNTPVSMGPPITMGQNPSGVLTRTYQAVVEKNPGTELKTGRFNTSMTVVVTYN
ncbi:fimbrial protein [Salmonella enterica subsp. enterica]|nr:fimbrial protein [Salmonella enterica subsp. enterica]